MSENPIIRTQLTTPTSIRLVIEPTWEDQDILKRFNDQLPWYKTNYSMPAAGFSSPSKLIIEQRQPETKPITYSIIRKSTENLIDLRKDAVEVIGLAPNTYYTFRISVQYDKWEMSVITSVDHSFKTETDAFGCINTKIVKKKITFVKTPETALYTNLLFIGLKGAGKSSTISHISRENEWKFSPFVFDNAGRVINSNDVNSESRHGTKGVRQYIAGPFKIFDLQGFTDREVRPDSTLFHVMCNIIKGDKKAQEITNEIDDNTPIRTNLPYGEFSDAIHGIVVVVSGQEFDKRELGKQLYNLVRSKFKRIPMVIVHTKLDTIAIGKFSLVDNKVLSSLRSFVEPKKGIITCDSLKPQHVFPGFPPNLKSDETHYYYGRLLSEMMWLVTSGMTENIQDANLFDKYPLKILCDGQEHTQYIPKNNNSFDLKSEIRALLKTDGIINIVQGKDIIHKVLEVDIFKCINVYVKYLFKILPLSHSYTHKNNGSEIECTKAELITKISQIENVKGNIGIMQEANGKLVHINPKDIKYNDICYYFTESKTKHFTVRVNNDVLDHSMDVSYAHDYEIIDIEQILKQINATVENPILISDGKVITKVREIQSELKIIDRSLLETKTKEFTLIIENDKYRYTTSISYTNDESLIDVSSLLLHVKHDAPIQDPILMSNGNIITKVADIKNELRVYSKSVYDVISFYFKINNGPNIYPGNVSRTFAKLDPYLLLEQTNLKISHLDKMNITLKDENNKIIINNTDIIQSSTLNMVVTVKYDIYMKTQSLISYLEDNLDLIAIEETTFSTILKPYLQSQKHNGITFLKLTNSKLNGIKDENGELSEPEVDTIMAFITKINKEQSENN